LAGAVIGHIAAAVHPQDTDAALLQLLFPPQQVLGVTLAAEGVDVRVFQEK
jgi:hypothetical protein